MTVVPDWIQIAATAAFVDLTSGSPRALDDQRAQADRRLIEEAIRRCCPFKPDTAYMPVSSRMAVVFRRELVPNEPEFVTVVTDDSASIIVSDSIGGVWVKE